MVRMIRKLIAAVLNSVRSLKATVSARIIAARIIVKISFMFSFASMV